MMSAQEYLTNVAFILAAMAAIARLEAAVPLVARPTPAPGRRRANLAMTVQVLLTAFALTSAVAAVALVVPFESPGLMTLAGLPLAAQFVVGIVALDFAYGYVAHRAMHVAPALWRFHRVHHSDAIVDVTTSYRTHPVEVAWRHLWLFATAWTLGIPAAAIVAFRVLSALNGILEHANIRVRPALDAAISWLWVTPNMHKVHHSRLQAETDSNYGNLLTLYDRLLGTFVPTQRAPSVTYGVDDVDPAEARSFGAIMAMPWRSTNRRHPVALQVKA
jgi:sterol desaturase/sphingolipid hydroxylase (fatty acid hydroxylase superfamily)